MQNFRIKTDEASSNAQLIPCPVPGLPHVTMVDIELLMHFFTGAGTLGTGLTTYRQ